MASIPTAPQIPYRRLSGAMRAPQIGFPVLVAVLLGYVLLFPPQFALNIGNTKIPGFRFVLIPAVMMIAQALARRELTFRWPDAFILMTSFWVSLSMFVTSEFEEAFTAAIAQTTDMGIAYFFGRVTIRTLRDFRIFLILMAPGLGFIGASLVIESVTHQPFIQQFASSITGGSIRFRSTPRYGLFRAPGPFPHPILAGIFMASFLPLYVMSGLRGWPKLLGIVAAIGSFFTMSSAALLALNAGLALPIYNWLTERISNISWRLFFIATAIFIFVAEVSGAGTYRLLIKYASLNSSSAYNRVRIWNWGSISVEKNPWFGIGYADYDRPGWLGASVDNFWLLIAIRHGALPSVMILITTILVVLLLMRASRTTTRTDQRALRAVAIAIAVYAFGATSVFLWGSPVVWFFFLLGLGASVASSSLEQSKPLRPQPPGLAPLAAIERRQAMLRR